MGPTIDPGGPWMICAGSFFSRLRGWGTVTFRLSGFYCTVTIRSPCSSLHAYCRDLENYKPSWSQIPDVAMVAYASSVPEDDVGS